MNLNNHYASALSGKASVCIADFSLCGNTPPDCWLGYGYEAEPFISGRDSLNIKTFLKKGFYYNLQSVEILDYFFPKNLSDTENNPGAAAKNIAIIPYVESLSKYLKPTPANSTIKISIDTPVKCFIKAGTVSNSSLMRLLASLVLMFSCFNFFTSIAACLVLLSSIAISPEILPLKNKIGKCLLIKVYQINKKINYPDASVHYIQLPLENVCYPSYPDFINNNKTDKGDVKIENKKYGQ